MAIANKIIAELEAGRSPLARTLVPHVQVLTLRVAERDHRDRQTAPPIRWTPVTPLRRQFHHGAG
ncbi:hypothetical protein QN224_30725 [Sinorhizobium sp. 8-89]|uniref:hypothetical protein n=1 Tax=Sinorhizobium sp. 7-81 TaxID=3049087 RepID=UPI0024C22157|nr:hypothetical protein [Sinorhizobium sp. 7-81]MDK1389733.1 hypothetical protein [Sinorhizobium sp. 7-81]